MKKIIALFIVLVIAFALVGCVDDSQSRQDTIAQIEIANKLQSRQPTPVDIDYSLERYNLIRRAYWVNGQRAKAMSYPCPIADMPLGYIIMFEYGTIVGKFTVEGKLSSLNSWLTPESEYYEKNSSSSTGTWNNKWLADVDGSFGVNADGVFFFTPNGQYFEWTGVYLYSDIPFELSVAPLVKENTPNE